MIFTDAAFSANDGKSLYGYCMKKNDIPTIIGFLYETQRSLPLKKRKCRAKRSMLQRILRHSFVGC